MRILLEFASGQTEVHQARLRYAFSLFCAVYGHDPVSDLERESADAWIHYGDGIQSGSKPAIRLSNLYRPRSLHVPAPPPTPFERAGEKTVLFYSPGPGQQPDWLGEIFEWISCADEYSVHSHNGMGRIPYAKSYVGRHKLDACVPYAAIAMRFLQRALCEAMPRCSMEPQSPVPSVRHFVICTHDIDFLPVSYSSSLGRLAKNAIISLLIHRFPRLAMHQTVELLRMTLGKGHPLDLTSGLAQAEVRRGYSASYYFLVRHGHRRDGNYPIDEPMVLDLMRSLERQGMEVGVHGSYRSMEEPEGLAYEFACLRKLGFHAEGGRQHWLRFTLDQLIPACERAGALYDTSLGWSECIGFRGGACFAFPPYNFKQERPATFLEIPLTLMDLSLLQCGNSEEDWYHRVDAILSTSRRYGWGGIAVLWHNTAFGEVQLPAGIGHTLWRAVDQREEWNDNWLGAGDFIRCVRERYVDVGLLPAECGVPIEPALAEYPRADVPPLERME